MLVTDPRHKKEQTIGGLPGPSGMGSCRSALSFFAMCVFLFFTAVKPKGIAPTVNCPCFFCRSLVPLQGLQTDVRNKCVEKLVSVLAAALRV